MSKFLLSFGKASSLRPDPRLILPQAKIQVFISLLIDAIEHFLTREYFAQQSDIAKI